MSSFSARPVGLLPQLAAPTKKVRPSTRLPSIALALCVPTRVLIGWLRYLVGTPPKIGSDARRRIGNFYQYHTGRVRESVLNFHGGCDNMYAVFRETTYPLDISIEETAQFQ